MKIPKDTCKGNTLIEELRFLDGPTCFIEQVPNLILDLEIRDLPSIMSPLLGDSKYRSVYGGEGFLPEDSFIFLNSFILSQGSFNPGQSTLSVKRWLRAGPRKNNFFKSEDVKAVITTCGGICPGLNVVIRELVMSLYYN